MKYYHVIKTGKADKGKELNGLEASGCRSVNVRSRPWKLHVGLNRGRSFVLHNAQRTVKDLMNDKGLWRDGKIEICF